MLDQIRALVWTHRKLLVLGAVLTIVARLAALVVPASSKFLIDEVVLKRRGDLLAWLALAAALATVIQVGLSLALAHVFGITGQRSVNGLRRRVYEHVLRLPTRYFDGVHSGAILSRIVTDTEAAKMIVGSGLISLLGSVVTAAVVFAVLCYLNWRLSLLIVAIFVLMGATTLVSCARLRPLFRDRGRLQAELMGRLNECIAGIRVVKTCAAEPRQRLIFAKDVHRLFRNVARTITQASLAGGLGNLIVSGGGLLLLVVGGKAILDGRMTLGDFAMFVSLVGVAAAPITQVVTLAPQLTDALAALERLDELLKTPAEDADGRTRRPLGRLAGEVVCEHVEFEYEAGRPVLTDISFAAAPGSTTAVVGRSGAGKSTLMSLIAAFNRPTMGRILVDGVDLSTVRLKDYRSQLGVVHQETFLFDGSVAANIGYAKPRATAEEIRRASRLANADEFIERLPEGYATHIGERGVRLSGGQRQRLAIARAILADPRVLILDEAMSSLDAENADLIHEALGRLRRDRTTFVIAHRLPTVSAADQILALDGGRIVDTGSHDALMQRSACYRDLFALRAVQGRCRGRAAEIAAPV